MSARQRRGSFMYAQADGTVIRAGEGDDGLATVGVVLKDEHRRPVISFAEKVSADNRVEAQCRSIIAALDAAKMHGANAVTVYCPNSAVVGELNGELPRNPEMIKQYLLITAHMNRFQRASIRDAHNGRNWQPIQLARDHASRLSGQGVAANLSLFPVAA